MNFLPYAFVFGLLAGIAIDCVAMVGGAAAVNYHMRKKSESNSRSHSESNDLIPEDYAKFIHAIQKNKLADAITLLSKNKEFLNFRDPVDGQTPLTKATIAKRPEMVQFLLQQPKIKKNIKDKSNRTALQWAELMNYKKITKLLKGEPVKLSPWWKRRKK